jgi:hypothetical protein
MAYYPPPPAQRSREPSTIYGVVGIVGAFCCLPLGVIFGVLSVRAARRSGRPATLGYIAIGLSVAVAIAHIFIWSVGGYQHRRW